MSRPKIEDSKNANNIKKFTWKVVEWYGFNANNFGEWKR